MSIPDFSPRMLRLFLEARVVFRLATGDVPALPAAVSARARVTGEMFRTLAARAGLPAATVRLAHQGRVNRAAARIALWCALGIVPGEHGAGLTDDGGQFAIGAVHAAHPESPNGRPARLPGRPQRSRAAATAEDKDHG